MSLNRFDRKDKPAPNVSANASIRSDSQPAPRSTEQDTDDSEVIEKVETPKEKVKITKGLWVNPESFALGAKDGAKIETSIELIEEDAKKRLLIQAYSQAPNAKVQFASKPEIELLLNPTDGSLDFWLEYNDDLPHPTQNEIQPVQADYWFTAKHEDSKAVFTSDKIKLPLEKAIACVAEVHNVHFTSNSILPHIGESGDLFANLVYFLDYASTHPEQVLVLSGHTDASGETDFNFELSLDRAKMVKAILDHDADTWTDILKKRAAPQDYQALLNHFSLYFCWDCHTGIVDNLPGANTKKGLSTFQETYNELFQGKLDVDGQIGPMTWKAILHTLHSELQDNWKEYRGSIFPTLSYGYDGKGVYPCGETFAKATENKAQERRVELTFYDETKLPKLLDPPAPNQITPKYYPIYNKTRVKQIPIWEVHPESIGEVLYNPQTHEVAIIPSASMYTFLRSEQELCGPIQLMKTAEQKLDPNTPSTAKDLELAKGKVNQAVLKATMDKPLAKSTGGEFVEFIRLNGNKFIYLPANKVKKGIKTYKLTNDDGKSHKLRDSKGTIKRDLIKKQMSNVTAKAKYELGKAETTGEITEIFGKAGEALDKKLKEMNESLVTGSSNHSDPTRIWDTKAEAKLMRYYAGASAATEFNLKEGVLGLNAGASAQLALAEGKTDINLYLCHAQGWHCKFDLTTRQGGKDTYDLGFFRIVFSAELSGFAGVSAQASANLNIGSKKDGFLMKGQHDTSDAVGKAGGRLFAGVEAGLKVSAALQWDNAESKKQEFKVVAQTAYQLMGSAGISAEAEIGVGYENGKIIVKAKLGLTVGLGLKGSLDYEIGLDTIVEFIKMVYKQLEKNDFKFLAYIDEKAFEAISNIALKIIWFGIAPQYVIYEKAADNMDRWWRDLSSTLQAENKLQKEGEALALKIQAQPEMLKYLSPEAKGRLIATLCPTSYTSFEERQEAAVLDIIDTLAGQKHSKAQYHNICRNVHKEFLYITQDIRLLWEESLWKKGEDIILKLLDGGSQTTFKTKINGFT